MLPLPLLYLIGTIDTVDGDWLSIELTPARYCYAHPSWVVGTLTEGSTVIVLHCEPGE